METLVALLLVGFVCALVAMSLDAVRTPTKKTITKDNA